MTATEPSPTPQRSTIRDVALEAGVSTATVSRVLNRSPNVSAGTRAGVLEAMERHGFNRMYVLQYYLQPRQPALEPLFPGCVASLNTHDMPTFAAFFQGLDGVRLAETTTSADGRWHARFEVPREIPVGVRRLIARTRGDERRAPSTSP